MTRLARRAVFAPSLLVFACFLGILGSRGAVAQPIPEQPLANPASASPCLKYLPKDYSLVGELDWKTAMLFLNSEQAKKNPQFAQFQQALQMAKLMTGIDAGTEVDRLTLFAAGALDKEPKMLIAVQGSFNNDAVKGHVGADGQTQTYRNQTIYSIGKTNFCFPENSLILVGDDSIVRAAIDRVDGGAQPLPEGLQKVLDRTPAGSLVWVAVRVQPVLDSTYLTDWRTNNADLHAALAKIDCLSIAGNIVEDGLSLTALGFASTTGQASAVHQFLADRKKAVLHSEGTNVVFTTLLILSELKTSGPYVQGALRITAQAMQELWETKMIVKP